MQRRRRRRTCSTGLNRFDDVGWTCCQCAEFNDEDRQACAICGHKNCGNLIDTSLGDLLRPILAREAGN